MTAKSLDEIPAEDHLDRRRQPRIVFRSTVDVVYQGVLVTPPLSAADISEGGLRLEGLCMSPERLIKIFITLPLQRQGKRLLLLKGKVAWQSESTVGIQFLNLSPESAVSLHQFVSEQLAIPPN